MSMPIAACTQCVTAAKPPARCLVYRTPTEAAEALRALALDDEELPALTLRPARLAASHPDSRLEVRVARQSDKKIA
ncbi:hypothetical protein P167DRAFT_576397, partial [Morchella conica CCBAS932]